LLRRLAVRRGVEFGAGLHVGPGSRLWAPRRLRIGDNVYIGKRVTLEVDGVIGDSVLIANNVGVVGRYDHDFRQVGVPVSGARWVGEFPETLSHAVRIGSDVWIGFGAVILSGISIGDSAVVAAGSVVRNDVPENSVVAGNPATVVGRRFDPAQFAQHWSRLSANGVARHDWSVE